MGTCLGAASSSVGVFAHKDSDLVQQEEDPVPLQVENSVNSGTNRRRRKHSNEEDVAADRSDLDDSDFDPKEMVDSDYEIDSGDDDLFEDNVDNSEDEEVKIPKGQGMEKAKVRALEAKQKLKAMMEQPNWEECIEEDVEEEGLWAPHDENSSSLPPPRYKIFTEEEIGRAHV